MNQPRTFLKIPKESHFPIQNLPYGVFIPRGQKISRVGVAIGDWILDLAALESRGLINSGNHIPVFNQDSLNPFISLGHDAWISIRKQITDLLDENTPTLRDNASLLGQILFSQGDVTMLMPVNVTGYTDFYASKEHATNVGSMFRDPANALLPNWSEIPIGYNGRASSVVISGTHVRRPMGQIKLPDDTRPIFSACRKLDFELEMAFIVGQNSQLGEPISIEQAPEYIFGMVLLNDWSARDIQQWEYVPLGPFNSKTFASSISPWVVPMIALEPFRVTSPIQNPQPLPYLQQTSAQSYDIELQVTLQAEYESKPTVISQTNFKTMYWSMTQQLAHHTVSGCNVRIGDLMGSGTISGSTPNSFGSLLELTWNGQKTLQTSTGKQRTFIEDGDTISMTGFAQGNGYRIGFGEVTGKVLPALQS